MGPTVPILKAIVRMKCELPKSVGRVVGNTLNAHLATLY